MDLALALVAPATADPTLAKALLGEARTALDSMPAEARALRTTRWAEGLMDEALRGAR